MPTDIKFSQVQISKIIQSGGSFGFWLGKLGKKSIYSPCYSFCQNNVPVVESNVESNMALNEINIF